MAYAYKAVDELLEPQKQNIFATEQGAPPVPGQTQGQGDGVKTSTSSEVSSGGSGGSSSEAGPSSSQPLDSGASARAAVKANAGKTAQPAAFGQVQSQLSKNQAALQGEADAYVAKGKAAQTYALGHDDFEGAIGGNQAKADSVRGLLGRQDINAVDSDFKFSGPEVRDADLLRNDAGLKQLAARGQGPGYTSGMGAFDVQTLRKTPGFENIVSMIQGQQQSLKDKTAEYEKGKRAEVEAYGQDALTGAKRDATSWLTGAAGQIDQGNEREKTIANQLLAQYRAQGIPDAESRALSDAREAVRGDTQQIDPRSARFVDKAAVDPRKYLKVRSDYGRDDFVDAKEAQRFNAITGLLGAADTRSVSAPKGSDYAFDQKALQKKIISGTANLRAQADTGQREALRKIEASVAQRAAAENDKNSKLDLGAIASEKSKDVISQVPEDLKKYLPGIIASKSLSPGNFIKGVPEMGMADYYTVPEAKKINKIYEDLGLKERVKSGGGFGNSGKPAFDSAGYSKALIAALQQQDRLENYDSAY